MADSALLKSTEPSGEKQKFVASGWLRNPTLADKEAEALLAAGATKVQLVARSCGCGGRPKTERVVKAWP